MSTNRSRKAEARKNFATLDQLATVTAHAAKGHLTKQQIQAVIDGNDPFDPFAVRQGIWMEIPLYTTNPMDHYVQTKQKAGISLHSHVEAFAREMFIQSRKPAQQRKNNMGVKRVARLIKVKAKYFKALGKLRKGSNFGNAFHYAIESKKLFKLCDPITPFEILSIMPSFPKHPHRVIFMAHPLSPKGESGHASGAAWIPTLSRLDEDEVYVDTFETEGGNFGDDDELIFEAC